MKLVEKFSGPVTPSRALGCMAANLFLTPGLGSLIGRRYVAAIGQLTIFIAGFLMFVVWFFDVVRQYYAMAEHDVTPVMHHWLAFVGVGFCALGWLWALGTSISLFREGKRNEQAGKMTAG
ncbi:MAG: hypothetical protein RLY20_1977 [Verrucomicrobiota bacterium]|jgi:hypothetical protein